MNKTRLWPYMLIFLFLFCGCKHEHKYEEDVIAPSCTTQGYIIYKCTCGESYIDEYINSFGHCFDEWQIIKEATEENTGIRERYCIRCLFKQSEEIPVKNHEHTYSQNKIDPTCTEDGYIENVCRCGDSFKTDIIKAKHTKIDIPEINATCSTYGYTSGVKCLICEIYLVEPKKIEMISHSIVIDEGIEATCLNTGLSEGKHCEVCNEIIVKQEVLPSLNHNIDIENNVCTYCGEKQYFEVRSENDLKASDFSGKDMIIYLDYCISVDEDTKYWTLNVAPETRYIRLVGEAGVQYNFSLDIDAARTEPIKVDLVNVTLKTLIDRPIINSLSQSPLHIGMYGEVCQIIGKDGINGDNGSILIFSYDGKRGNDGNVAINTNGDVDIYVEANNAIIKGGNGGKGGNGMSAVPAPQDGGNGGAGGNGAYAIRASSVTVKFANGYNNSNLSLTGGIGGEGGNGGSGFLWGKDGKKGANGNSSKAANIIVDYE